MRAKWLRLQDAVERDKVKPDELELKQTLIAVGYKTIIEVFLWICSIFAVIVADDARIIVGGWGWGGGVRLF